MMGISLYALIFGTWNVYVLTVKAFENPKASVIQREERWYEKSLFHRHLMWVFSCIAAIIQAWTSYWFIKKNRYYLPSVLSFYSK
jgi:magnesium-transporting ATPase (P-type)